MKKIDQDDLLNKTHELLKPRRHQYYWFRAKQTLVILLVFCTTLAMFIFFQSPEKFEKDPQKLTNQNTIQYMPNRIYDVIHTEQITQKGRLSNIIISNIKQNDIQVITNKSYSIKNIEEINSSKITDQELRQLIAQFDASVKLVKIGGKWRGF